MTTFAGRWLTTFGLMELTEQDGAVQGTYWNQGVPCTIEGQHQGNRLAFHYREPAEQGEGWFELTRVWAFRGPMARRGQRGLAGVAGPHSAWDGVWETSFGRLRLVEEPDRVLGFYDGAGPSRIEGEIEDGRLVFRYEEPQARRRLLRAGRGWPELRRPMASEAMPEWATWVGRRVRPVPGRTWLMIVEAHWQRSVAEGEYSFGGMLREFFARSSDVAVGGVSTTRRVCNAGAASCCTSRNRRSCWCPATAHPKASTCMAEPSTPAASSIACGTRTTFSCCTSHRAWCCTRSSRATSPAGLSMGPPFAVSGYTTSVDWGGSAVIEFTYLDLILTKGLTPAEAAAKLPCLIRYAGDDAPDDSPYAAAGFRFFPAGTLEPSAVQEVD